MGDTPTRRKIRVLWMDDQPEFVDTYTKILRAAGSLIEIDVARTIGEARKGLEGGKYSGLVVDCRMGDEELSENGAVIAHEISRTRPGFPVFVVSGFLQHAPYRQLLDEAYCVWEEGKPPTVQRPVMESGLFRLIYEAGITYSQWKDKKPEHVTLGEYTNNVDVYEGLSSAHWSKHKHWILEAMRKKGLAWVVVCGGEIVDQSSSMEDFPDEQRLAEIARRKGYVPFAYSRLVPPESVEPRPNTWNATVEAGDSYPSIRVKIGTWDAAEDFDTGAFKTFVSDEIVKKGFFDSWRDEFHLGDRYEFCTKRIEFAVVGDDGRVETVNIPVYVVKRWSGSPFVRMNIRRRILVGRDVLRAIRMTVTLDSNDQITRVAFLT